MVSNEFTAALAEQLAASEALIQRSADARAAALGTTSDAVLAGWSGAAAPPAAAQPEPVVAQESEPEPVVPEPKPEAATPQPVVLPAPADEQQPAPAPTPLEEAPTLVREPEPAHSGSLGSMVVGSLVIFAIMLIAAVVAPSSSGNAQTLDAVDRIELSADALNGREVYLAEGCAYCHTQQVRPIVTDADLGVVTLSDSPLVPGVQRLGPDLAHVGSRAPTDSDSWLTSYLTDPAAFPESSHASFGYLSSRDVQAVVAYLLESK